MPPPHLPPPSYISTLYRGFGNPLSRVLAAEEAAPGFWQRTRPSISGPSSALAVRAYPFRNSTGHRKGSRGKSHTIAKQNRDNLHVAVKRGSPQRSPPVVRCGLVHLSPWKNETNGRALPLHSGGYPTYPLGRPKLARKEQAKPREGWSTFGRASVRTSISLFDA